MKRCLKNCVLLLPWYFGFVDLSAHVKSVDIDIDYHVLYDTAHLFHQVKVPEAFLTTEVYRNRELKFGGDVRIGDLTGGGVMDFVIYRGTGDMHDGGGYKPNFLGAFDLESNILWHLGEKSRGKQPGRPGAVAIHDLDANGRTDVICLFVDADRSEYPDSFEDVEILLIDGATGRIKRRAAPPELTVLSGSGRQWAHQRIKIANLRGNPTPQDFVVKLGHTVLAFDDELNVLWTYQMPAAFDDLDHEIVVSYIPTVGDINGDGRDAVFGGYYLIDAPKSFTFLIISFFTVNLPGKDVPRD